MSRDKFYAVGDTVTITQEMEDQAAAMDQYIVCNEDGPRLIGPCGLKQAVREAKQLTEAHNGDFIFWVVPFTSSNYIIKRPPLKTYVVTAQGGIKDG